MMAMTCSTTTVARCERTEFEPIKRIREDEDETIDDRLVVCNNEWAQSDSSNG
jgi:hypothetical protein